LAVILLASFPLPTLNTLLVYASTTVSGQITSNTIWTKADSPYIVTGNILVSQGATLTIEPGGIVKFDSGRLMQVDGELIARGTQTESIVFTSNQPAPAPGDWGGIQFTDSSVDAIYDGEGNYISGSIMQYCTVEYGNGLDMRDSSLFIDHCTIRSNDGKGIYVSRGSPRITNNIITNHTSEGGGGIRIKGGEVIISGNTINDNVEQYSGLPPIIGGGGILVEDDAKVTINGNIINNNAAYYGGGISICESTATISGNTISANWAGGGIYIYGSWSMTYWPRKVTIIGNTIKNNSKYGIYAGAGIVTISLNSIISNKGDGIYFYGKPSINYNNIYDNTPYDINNGSYDSTDATNNWWGTTNEATIGAHIYDWVDKTSLGVVTFKPYLTSPILPTASLSFTSLQPPSITTAVSTYDAELTATGTNFNNVNQVTFTWSGPDNGTDTWDKGSSTWNSRVTVNSDTSMTLRPRVLYNESGTQSKTWTWTVTLRDTTGATASQSFTVTYTPPFEASPATIYVPDNYPTIQAAVDAANPGDTIIVRDGTYTENVNVNKDHLTIKSENGADLTIVQAANPDDHIFGVSSNYVTISGFTVRGQGVWGEFPYFPAGISLGDIDCTTVIYPGPSSTHCIISDNFVMDIYYGIRLVRSNNNSVTNNAVSNTNDGICLYEYDEWNILSNNVISDSIDYGIYVRASNNILSGNTISNNGVGLFLEDATDNFIYCNNVLDNSSRVWLLRSTSIWNSPDEMNYTYNGNTYTNYLGNHWNNYSGNDADGDGIGDTSYPIGSDADNYPLMEPFENYVIGEEAPPTLLSFTNLQPSSITTSASTYDATLTATGTNFNNVNQVTFSWSGPDSGADTWDKSSSTWNNRVTVNSDTSMTLRPRVLYNESGTQSETWTWTVTLKDTTGATATKQFTVTHLSEPKTGTIAVTTNLYDATFVITGTKSYSGSGNTWIVFEAPIGSYTIIYEEMNGYTAPLPETKVLISGGKIVFSGEYVKQIENGEQPVNLLTFFTHVLEQLGIPSNGFALNALQIWARYEDTNAQYNPLATTMPTHKPGETNFNSAGVKNYPDMETGIDATARTIDLSYYTPIREMLALESFDEEGVKKAVATWSGLTESAQYVQNLVNEWKEIWTTYQRLSDRITTRMKDKTPYPEYFWVPFKQAEYDELYQAGIDFDMLARNALIEAYHFLNKGDLENAQEYYDAYLSLKSTSDKYFYAASEFADGYYTNAETIVRVIYEVDKFAAKMVAIAAGPKAVTVINALYHGLDFYIDSETSGWTEAAKNLFIDVVLDAIVCKVEFDELGGRTIKNSLENRVGKITFPLIQEMLSENKQAIVSKIVKEGSLIGIVEFSKYTGEQLNKLFDQIIDGLAKRLIEQEQQIQLKSPGELRVYDSTGNVTGLINGSIKSEIPRSLYEDGSVTIFFPTDSYRYEVVGLDNGNYGLMVTSVDGENVSTFTLVDVPISKNATHQYIPAWDNSTETVSEVTLKIDSDGDAVFEQTISLLAAGETKGFPWVWIIVGAIVLVAYMVLRRAVRGKP
jgi:parallel beta-helix repeat protein